MNSLRLQIIWLYQKFKTSLLAVEEDIWEDKDGPTEIEKLLENLFPSSRKFKSLTCQIQVYMMAKS